MKSSGRIFRNKTAFITIVCFAFSTFMAKAQLLVDSKEVSKDKEIQYIQLLYYVEKSSFKPVYLIDYGLVDGQQTPLRKQKIIIGATEIKDSMSPMYIVNLLFKDGWEYLGDETYVQVPMAEGWYSFTLKRKK